MERQKDNKRHEKLLYCKFKCIDIMQEQKLGRQKLEIEMSWSYMYVQCACTVLSHHRLGLHAQSFEACFCSAILVESAVNN